MSRQTALISIEEFTFTDAFSILEGGTVGMEFKLLNPRPNVPLRKRAYTIHVDASGKPVLPNTFAERILFKESVDGPLGIRVESTGVEDPSLFEAFLRKAFSIAIKASGDVIATQWSEPMKSIARAPFRFLADEIDDDKEGPEIVAINTIDCTPEEGSSAISIKLLAVKDVYALQSQIRTRGPRKTKRRSSVPKLLIAKGDMVGEIKLNMVVS